MTTTKRTTKTTVTTISFTEEQLINILRRHLVVQGVDGASAAVIEFDVASQGFLRGAEAVITVTEVGNE